MSKKKPPTTIEECNAEMELTQKKIRQYENREKVLRQKLSQEERRTRSHRLIVRGAVFESIVPEAKTMTAEEAAEIEALIAKRTEARKAKDWATADAIRDALAARHIVVKDTPQGITWSVQG